MTRNMGALDRLTRVAFGGVIFVGGLVSGHWEMCIPTALAVATGAAGFCPIYTIFGFDSLEEAPRAVEAGHVEEAA